MDDATTRPCRDAALVSLVLEAGPDSGRAIRLPQGRFLIGRAAGVGRIADPSIEAHQLSLQIDAADAVAVTQLAGRVPARIGDRPIVGTSPVVLGSIITIGATRIAVHGVGRGDLVVRAPRSDDLSTRPPRASDPTEFVVGIGVGVVPLPILLVDAPGATVVDPSFVALARLARHERRLISVAADLAVHDRVAIVAPDDAAIAVVRSIIAQLAHRCDPSVWQLVRAGSFPGVSTHELPHGARCLDPRDSRRLVVVADTFGFAALRPSIEWLRGLGRPVSVIVIAGSDADVPDDIPATLTIGIAWRGVWCPDRFGGLADAVRLHISGATRETAQRSLAALASRTAPDLRTDRFVPAPDRHTIVGRAPLCSSTFRRPRCSGPIGTERCAGRARPRPISRGSSE